MFVRKCPQLNQREGSWVFRRCSFKIIENYFPYSACVFMLPVAGISKTLKTFSDARKRITVA